MIFLDANIFVDVLDNRDEWYEASAKILSYVRTGMRKGCMSAMTVPILSYVMGEKRNSNESIRAIIKDFKIIPLTIQIINESFDNPFDDFEDAIQFNSAIKGNCSVIITRNKKDFPKNGTMSIMTPEEFLSKH